MSNHKRVLALGTKKISTLLMEYAVPAIIAMTATSLYNITDSIFIGRGVGHMALSGLAITFPIMNLSAAFGTLVGVGGGTLMSIKMGEKDYNSANVILGNVVALNIIVGILLSVLTIPFLKPLLMLFGASENTIGYAYSYMLVIIAGNVFTHLFFGLNSQLRSMGHPKTAMIFAISSVFVNVILSALFIFTFKWGIFGAAFSTILTQMVAFIVQVFVVSNKKEAVRLQRRYLKIDIEIVRKFLSMGMPSFLMNTLACFVVIIINHGLLLYGGDLAVGAYGIINRFSFLFFMIVLGIQQGMQPIAGYNYGAKQYERVVSVFKKSVIAAVLVMIIGSLIGEIFPEQIAGVFTKEKELIDISATGMRWLFLVSPFIGFSVVSITLLQSMGRVRISIFLSLARQALVLIPLILILPKIFGITGIWMGIMLSDLISFVLTTFFMIRELRILNKHIKNQKNLCLKSRKKLNDLEGKSLLMNANPATKTITGK